MRLAARSVALLVPVLALILLPTVSADPNGSVQPQLTSYWDVFAETDQPVPFQGQRTYVDILQVQQNVTTVSFTAVGHTFMGNAYSNLSSLKMSGFTLLSNTTWINLTAGCGNLQCPDTGTFGCDGSFLPFNFPPNVRLNKPCYAIQFNGTIQSLFADPFHPAYLITHQFIYANNNLTTQWVSPGKGEQQARLNLTIPQRAGFFRGLPIIQTNGVHVARSSWLNYSCTEAVLSAPYPPGTWNPTRTQVSYINVSGQNVSFAQVQRGIVMQFRYAPAGIQNYSVQLFGISGPGVGPGYGNSSVVTSLTLDAENISQIGTGAFQATADWTNNGQVAFTGQVTIIGSWVATAFSEQVSVNSVSVPSVPSGTSVLIPSGVVNVTNGSTDHFAVSFKVSSTFRFNAAVFYLNGFAVTWVDLLVLLAIVLVVLVTFLHTTERIRTTLLSVTGLFLIGSLAAVWVAL